MAKQKQLPPKLQAWIDARRRFHLSHAQVQMARELGMNPKKLGGKANHKQEPWRTPLPRYIEELYLRRFKKERPDNVRSIEQMVADKQRKQADRRERKRRHREDSPPSDVIQPAAEADSNSVGAEKDEIPF